MDWGRVLEKCGALGNWPSLRQLGSLEVSDLSKYAAPGRVLASVSMI
jgi:hypothetical protein